MKKRQIIKIICKFKYSRLTVEIPRILFINYWEVWGSLENSLKIDRLRIEMSSFEQPSELRRRFHIKNKDRFDRHQEIFGSVYLNHVSRSNQEIEYFIQYALDHWLKQMEDRKREPSEYLVTEIRRARADPKVEVIKYARKAKPK